MKSLLLGIFILCFSSGLKSQNYHPFPHENAIWHAIGSNMFDENLYSQQYILQGDTIINGETWSKIYFNNIFLGTRNNMNYLAAIRENEQKQIIARFPWSPEFILYDFSLEIGDTIWYEHATASVVGGDYPFDFSYGEDFSPHYKLVVDKDSVLLENGQYRNRLILNSFHEQHGNLHIQNHWIEGFGCTNWSGLFHPIVVIRYLNGDGVTFACFMQDEEVIYLNNPYCDDCLCETFTSVAHVDDSDKLLAVYPNPSKGHITIKILESYAQNIVLVITDISGKKLFEKHLHNQQEINLNLSAYGSGFYIIQLLDVSRNKLLESKKIIIE